MDDLRSRLSGRHIQDFHNANNVEPHWGYADRVVPCTNDAGSCAYLDVVYGSHDLGMIYSGVFWLTVAAVVIVVAIARSFLPSKRALCDDATEGVGKGPSALTRFWRSASSGTRRYLLPESLRSVFGRTTRLQILVLAILTGYLTIWSFVGIAYETWITPVKNMPGVYNTRTSLGPWSDRIGVLAYALTPLSVLLANRESFLSAATGIPYQNFNFLHRWLGYIILVQSLLHTIGWTIIEVRLYQPQPSVAVAWITQLYMIWGIVAILLITILYVLSLPPVIRLTGYEFFRKSHYILAIVYAGACIGHWPQLQCFMIPSILLWFLDRVARGARTLLIHHKFIDGKGAFSAAQATVTVFSNAADRDGDIVRMDIKNSNVKWNVGQHFYLCFPDSSLWQSHPFTPLSDPGTVSGTGNVDQAYVFRARAGETRKITELAIARLTTPAPHEKSSNGNVSGTMMRVILTGPYGESITTGLVAGMNVLCVAGGTGITYVLPVLLGIAKQPPSDRLVELVWVVRHESDTAWIEPEMAILRAHAGIAVKIFVTRETKPASSSASASSSKQAEESAAELPGPRLSSNEERAPTKIDFLGKKEDVTPERRHPGLPALVREFVDATATGPTVVYGSGPGGFLTDLRKAVAACNDPGKVWKGQARFDVSLECDDRMER